MAVSEVVLRDFRGRDVAHLAETGLFRLDPILPIGDPEFPLLGWLDEYGYTYFSHHQMRPFPAEWHRLFARARDDDDLRLLRAVEQLAEQCQKTPHTHLTFIGD
jgi:hypothetical protein